MQTLLLVAELFIAIALIVFVLLQRSEGGALGGLGGGGGVGGFLTGRGQANALTRATAILDTVFFCTSLILGILAGLGRQPQSILDRAAPAGQSSPATPAPSGSPGILDQLRQLEGQGSGGAPQAPRP